MRSARSVSYTHLDVYKRQSRTTVGFSQNGSDGSSQGSFTMVNVADSTNAVSYTHLDVYKRQAYAQHCQLRPESRGSLLRLYAFHQNADAG